MQGLIKDIQKISADFPMGLCLMTDGREIKIKPEKVVDGGVYFDINAVKETLDIDYFEIVDVPSNKNLILVCDEEGLLQENPVLNFTATILAKRQIVGNVMVCNTTRIR